MNKKEVQEQLLSVHSELLNYVKSLGSDLITTSIPGKWSPAQNIKHLQLAILPVAKLLNDKPKFLSKNIGNSPSGSRSYVEITSNYFNGLTRGVKSPEKFVPGTCLHADQVTEIFGEYEKTIEELTQSLQFYTEDEMDTYQLIHPLLGLLTIREFMYFYMFHAIHHMQNIKRDVTELIKC